MVEAGVMKKANGVSRHVQKTISPKRRADLLAAFDHSGLSAAAFARKHGLNYTTFCGWRQRRRKRLPEFVQVELPASPASVELVVELGGHARVRLSSSTQIDLATNLIRSLNSTASC
jgi:hypothetical protein